MIFSNISNISNISNSFIHSIISIPWISLFFYTFLIFIFCFLLTLLYLKSKYGFWVSQPVFHIYDFSYYLFPPGILRLDLPDKNKYTNFKDITTSIYKELTSLQKTEMTYFIQKHYLKNGENIYIPEWKHIECYFNGLNENQHSSFFSFYWEKNWVSDLKKGTITETKKIIGCMTSRQVEIILLNKFSFNMRKDVKNLENNGQVKLNAYYVDYLCVDKSYRKKGIAPQLIQTHEYHQRHLNKNVCISVFKREGELTGIVPICVYKTYGFSIENWRQPISLAPPFSLLEATKQNMNLLLEFLKENQSQFDLIMQTNYTNLFELIQTNNVFLSFVLWEHQIVSCYFFRKTCVFIEKEKEILTCYASIKDDECPMDIFIGGFKNSFWKIATKYSFGFCAVEKISHNGWIVDNLLLKSKSMVESPAAYFFYNFSYPTFRAERVLCTF